MKWIFIGLNIIAAIGFVLFGSLATAVHNTHSYSMYHEFVGKGIIDDEKMKSLEHSEEHYDVVKRMQAIGNAKSWFENISTAAAVVCLFNAGVIFLLAGRSNRQKIVP